MIISNLKRRDKNQKNIRILGKKKQKKNKKKMNKPVRLKLKR